MVNSPSSLVDLHRPWTYTSYLGPSHPFFLPLGIQDLSPVPP